MTKKAIIFVFAAVAVWATTAGNAQAIGLAVAPSEISISGSVGRPAEARLTVTNTSNGVALFEAYPDDLRSMIDIFPASFTLQGGESRTITVTVNASSAGRFETMISVTANPMSSEGLRAGAGIKVPLRATIADGPAGLLANISGMLGASALPVGAGLAVLALFLRFFRISPRKRRGSDTLGNL